MGFGLVKQKPNGITNTSYYEKFANNALSSHKNIKIWKQKKK